MRIQSWNYLDTVEVIGSIPVAPTSLQSAYQHVRFPKHKKGKQMVKPHLAAPANPTKTALKPHAATHTQ